jgi:hypothetical protein
LLHVRIEPASFSLFGGRFVLFFAINFLQPTTVRDESLTAGVRRLLCLAREGGLRIRTLSPRRFVVMA